MSLPAALFELFCAPPTDREGRDEGRGGQSWAHNRKKELSVRRADANATSQDQRGNEGSTPLAAAQQRAEYDADCLRRIKAGDSAGLGDLLRTHFAWLVRVATPIAGSSDLAQDVVQDVFMHLADIREQLDIRGTVGAYLYRAVVNRARNLQRNERAQRNLEARMSELYDHAEPRVRNVGEIAVVSTEFHADLSRALAQLPPRAREVFLLRAEQGLSHAEIAEVFGISVGTVYTQLYRATRHLAKELAGWDGPLGDYPKEPA